MHIYPFAPACLTLCSAPYCERRGVGCPVALVANGRSQRGSSHGNDAGCCNNVRFVSCVTPPLGFCPNYNPVHETQREASHACPSEFHHRSARTSSFVQLTHSLLVAQGPFHLLYYHKYSDCYNLYFMCTNSRSRINSLTQCEGS